MGKVILLACQLIALLQHVVVRLLSITILHSFSCPPSHCTCSSTSRYFRLALNAPDVINHGFRYFPQTFASVRFASAKSTVGAHLGPAPTLRTRSGGCSVAAMSVGNDGKERVVLPTLQDDVGRLVLLRVAEAALLFCFLLLLLLLFGVGVIFAAAAEPSSSSFILFRVVFILLLLLVAARRFVAVGCCCRKDDDEDDDVGIVVSKIVELASRTSGTRNAVILNTSLFPSFSGRRIVSSEA